MEECKSQLPPPVYDLDVEEGEISSDSASSVEEISAEAFTKRDRSPAASAAAAITDSDSSSAAPPPPTPKDINVSSASSNNSTNNYHHNSVNNHNSNQKPRLWTMSDLYNKYHQYPINYSAGLVNLAWASGVHNKPLDLDEILVMEYPRDNNATNSNLKPNLANKNSTTTGDSSKDTSKDDGVSSAAAAASSSGKNAVIRVDEKEEGELEEGEIDMDSEMGETDGDVTKDNLSGAIINDKAALFRKQVDLLRKEFQSVTADEAQKSFGEVSSRVQNLLDSMQEIAEKNILTAKDIPVQLMMTAIKTVNAVFCSMDLNKKKSSKEIMSRLLAHASSQKYLFSSDQLKEIEALYSSFETLSSKDAYKIGEMRELGLVSKNDMDTSDSVKKSSGEVFNVDSVSVQSADQPVQPALLEYGPSGLANSKYKGLSLPLLDLRTDHDADSLPSPTQGGPTLPIVKGFSVGHGLLKPEWPVPRVAIERENISMHPYETDAVKAVSSYQQKFGRSSFLMSERLPSPTPSEDGDHGDGDISGEVSSSSGVDVKPVGTLMEPLLTFSDAPKIDIFTGQGRADLLNAPSLSSGPITSIRISSAKSRDPRLRVAKYDVAASNHVLPVISSEPKVDPVGGMISSRKQKTSEELVMDGPALKRQRNEQTDAQAVNSMQGASGTGGWLEDRGMAGLGAINRSQALDSSRNGAWRPECAVTPVSSGSILTNVTVNGNGNGNGNENLPQTNTGATASLHSLLKDIAVNPSIWMNIVKMEQQKSADPTRTTSQPTFSNSMSGALAAVVSKPPLLGQQAAGTFQVTPQTASVEEPGKVRMKPRDPRRVLHTNTLQKGSSMEFDQSQVKTSKSSNPSVLGSMNIQKQDDQLDRRGALSNSFVPPDIARQFTKNLKNIADIVSVSQANSSQRAVPQISQSQPSQGYQGRTEMMGLLDSGKLQSAPGLSFKEVSMSSSQPQNNWDDVDHLFEGFDDQQKAAIHRERARRLQEQRKMFAGRKLCLVLDLDHTLLNSAKFVEVDPVHDEILRKKEEQDREKPHRHLFRFPHMGMWTKLRPGIWNFLEKASKLYELHLYTMGNKLYATEMAKLLDPKGELFAGRVISRGDDGDLLDGDDRVPKSKDLEGVMGMESAVVIIDDSVRVWPHNKLNLIVVERYIFFPCSRRQFGLPGPSLLEIDHDERSEDGTLASSLAVIQRIHEIFFAHQSLDEADVRNILASEQRKILAGCRIVFSRVFPVGEANPQLHPLWQTAEQFGAVCSNSIDEQVTHVVANSLGTDKVNWALSTGRFVVHPGWVEASALLYRRASEKDFAIKP